MMGKVLIKGGTVLSLDRAVGNMVEADVLIEDGSHQRGGYVAASSERRGRRCRRHDRHARVRRHPPPPVAVPASATPERSATTVRPELSGHYTPDDLYAATLVGLLQALEAGITTVVDWCDVSGDAAHLEAALTAHADSGLRTVFVPVATDSAQRRPLTPRSRSPPPTSSRPNSTSSRPDGPRHAKRDGGFMPMPAPPRRRVARLPSWVAEGCSGPMSRCPTAPA